MEKHLFKNKIFVECSNDKYLAGELTNILKTLCNKSVDPDHVGSKSKVLKILFGKSINSIGLVDEDPGSPWPKNYNHVRSNKVKYSDDLFYYVELENENILVIISPRLEDWLVKICEKSLNPEKLHRNTKLFEEVFDRCRNRVLEIFENLFEYIYKKYFEKAQIL